MTRPAPARSRFRYSAALAVAAIIAVIGAVPLVAAAPAALPVLLVPLVAMAWAWRAGTDVDHDGLVIRALLGSRRIAWSQVIALVPRGRRVHARLGDGAAVPLPAVGPSDLPRLVAASGGQIEPSTAQ